MLQDYAQDKMQDYQEHKKHLLEQLQMEVDKESGGEK